MANLFLIRELCNEKEMTIRDLAARLDMKDVSIHSLMKTGKTNTETLERIADILGVSVGYFFDEHPSVEKVSQRGNGNKNQIGNGNVMIESQANEIENLKQTIEHLKSLLEEKERTIQILMNK